VTSNCGVTNLRITYRVGLMDDGGIDVIPNMERATLVPRKRMQLLYLCL